MQMISGNAEKRYFSKSDTRVIKAVAILLILEHHLFFFPERLPGDITYLSLFKIYGKSIEYYIGAFALVAVAVFLTLSGYGMYLTAHNSCVDLTVKISTRLKKIYKLLTFGKFFSYSFPSG